MKNPVRASAHVLPVNLDLMVIGALEFSPQVMAIRTDPLIRQTAIVEEQAEFDWRAFIETKYDDLSDPVGNTLTTGGAPRFRDNNFSSSAGLRKRTTKGGEFEISQRIGYQDNNSNFFVPTQQGTARLELNFTQPLLAKSGTAYNSSRIVLAEIESNIAEDELSSQLQDHLLKVTESYWELHRSRAILLQKARVLTRAEAILQLLDARREFDSQRRQVLRARAAVATRRSEIAQAVMQIRNAEANLRMLVNNPQLVRARNIEVIPSEFPMHGHVPISISASLETALQNRPEIAQAIRRMRSTAVRLDMAKSELLPQLDLVISTYVAGLEGRSNIGPAYGNQFTEGEPGYSVGLFFEVPLGNRAARTRHERRLLQVRKALHEFNSTVEASMTEVEIAVRQTETAYQEILSKFQSMNAAETETDYLDARWRTIPGADRSATLLLEDLLDAQERVAVEEAGFVTAQVKYVLALANLKRVMGTLLKRKEKVAPAPKRLTPIPNPAPAPNPVPNPVPPTPEQPKIPKQGSVHRATPHVKGLSSWPKNRISSSRRSAASAVQGR